VRAPLPVLFFPIFYFFVSITPIAYLFVSNTTLGGASFNALVFNWLFTPELVSILYSTFMFASGGAALATLFALVYAWLVVRTDVPAKSLLETLPTTFLIVPFIVKSLMWIILLSPSIGVINKMLSPLLNGFVFNIYSMEGLIFAYGMGGFPFALLSIMPVLKSMDTSLEESARILGLGLLKTFFRITLPIIFPSVFTTFLLLTLIGLGNFDYPYILGGERIKTLATEIYYWTNQIVPPRYDIAVTYSLIYIITTFTGVSIYIWYTRKTFKFVVVTGKVSQKTVHILGKWRIFAFVSCLGMLTISFILPFIFLILTSFITFGALAEGLRLDFTLENYQKLLKLPLMDKSFINSISVAIITALLCTTSAIFMAYTSLKGKIRGSIFNEYLNNFPLTFPGIVYGFGLFWLILNIPFLSQSLYGTLWVIIISLIVIRLPYSIRFISNNLLQIGDELEEAARVSGASWFKSFTSVLMPLVKGGMISSFTYIFIESIKEIGALILLVSPNTIMFTVYLLQLYSQHAAAINVVAAGSVLLVLVVATSLALLKALERMQKL